MKSHKIRCIILAQISCFYNTMTPINNNTNQLYIEHNNIVLHRTMHQPSQNKSIDLSHLIALQYKFSNRSKTKPNTRSDNYNADADTDLHNSMVGGSSIRKHSIKKHSLRKHSSRKHSSRKHKSQRHSTKSKSKPNSKPNSNPNSKTNSKINSKTNSKPNSKPNSKTTTITSKQRKEKRKSRNKLPQSGGYEPDTATQNKLAYKREWYRKKSSDVRDYNKKYYQMKKLSNQQQPQQNTTTTKPT